MKKICLIILLFLNGCAVAYKTKSIGKQIHKLQAQILHANQSTKNSIDKLNSTWKKIADIETLRKKEGFEKAQSDMKDIDTIYQIDMVKRYQDFKSFSSKKWNLISKKKKIKKSDAEYQSFIELREYIEKLNKDYKLTNENLQKKVNGIQAFIKNLNIYEVDPEKLNQDVAQGLTRMDEPIILARQNIEKARVKLKRYPEDKQKKGLSILREMELILTELDKEKKELNPILSQYKKETKGKKGNMIVFPGMASHDILKIMEKKLIIIKEQVQKFNKKALSLKSIND